MSVCCECYVLSGRGLCDKLITRPEESYQLCCVGVCDPEKKPRECGGHGPRWAGAPKEKEIILYSVLYDLFLTFLMLIPVCKLRSKLNVPLAPPP